MKKAAAIALASLAVPASVFAQSALPPGQSTPQQRIVMMEKAQADRADELLREKHYEQQLAQLIQLMQQQIELQRNQLDLLRKQIDLQQQRLAQQQPERR